MAHQSYQMTKVPLPAHFVLIHGACHGGWCWYKIRCLLESIGHEVSCPDLSSSGIEPSNADTIFTFKDYNKPLDDFLASLPHGKKVILVGHSAGGHSLTKAIHDFHDKIQAAVFIAAAMLPNGFLTEQDISIGMPDLSKIGEISDSLDYNYGEGRDNPPTSLVLKKGIQRHIFYQMSPLEDCTLAAMLLKPCPIRAIGQAVFPEPIDDDDSKKVPRVYIKTLHDRAIALEQQDAMIKAWPPSDVYTIDSDHCPMFSNPSHLFGILAKIASKQY